MKLIRVGAGVLNQVPLDWKGNAARIRACIEEARSQGVSILCLPELCITGYGCEDAFFSRGVHEAALRTLREVVPATKGMVVSLGLPLFHGSAVVNAVCLAADGKILGFVAKKHLAGDGIHYEPRWFKPWPSGSRAEVELPGHGPDAAVFRCPIGDLLFEVGDVRIGFEICEDAWVAQRPGAALAAKGVDVIMNPSASHFAFGKQAVRERLVLEGSRAFGVSYIYSNLLGNEAGRIIYDGGALIACNGKMMARGPRFSFADHRLTTALVDVDATRMSQARTASFQPDLARPDSDCVWADLKYPALEPVAALAEPTSWEASPRLKHEELTRALALGLFDYLRKSRSAGLVVSLSGGCDSAVVATVSALMVDLGVAELGLAGFLDKLRYVQRLAGVRDAREAARRLLTCVYQSTRNSSEVTRSAARAVADAIGAEFHELDVDALVGRYTEMVSAAVGRSLGWGTDDVTLQNIQARVRGPAAWMITNIQNALLLSTSNRSEAAVGYATMDGDTCGGLSPIAGVDKAFLRQYLVWLETEGPAGLRPIPALAAVTCQAPTAELRPSEQKQTDEKDLMPYDLLDAVERAAIRDKLTPLEVYKQMRAAFPKIEATQLGAWVARFFELWCRNQWKRERYAPSFHLDDENLDPKTWCRFPILSSGYESELEELRAYIARG